MTKSANPFESLRGKRIVVGVPSGRQIECHTTMALAGLSSYTSLSGVRLAILNEVRSVVSAARNSIVTRAAALDPDYLMMIDSDMLFPPDAALRLAAHDLDIVCATYNRRVHPYTVLGHLIGERKDITGGVHEADYMPGGMMMIRYSVFKKIAYPWFFETYEWEGASPVLSFIKMLEDFSFIDLPLDIRQAVVQSPEFNAWLIANKVARDSWAEPNSLMISEDYNFCRKVRKAGFKIHCDFDLSFRTAHIGEQIVSLEPPKVAESVPADMSVGAPANAA